ncbi:aminotransferase class I/II-fold pyridoxal phosphate-dependent enzyme [Dinghuibacter silviterrae]|uniref:Glycine/serine hydroxymethyltransferase n=1 Tax=Dinghuibacter silviterrae TaxID=1539049 RepID=A0A4R8DJK2_9BACT|nr:aminotransferase class I/II-fold pyridoxal phosphate-dependent enzyme [Dinghuibacter silviterrae]TDW97494.1 glycine/serine hydroxymethyltransferase [Dinghuibacter silviterrae]
MPSKNTFAQRCIVSLEKEIRDTISLNASSCIEYPYIKKSFASNSHELTVEGSVRNRYFPIPGALDDLEEYAQKLYGELFGLPFVDVRPLTATHANISVFLGLLATGDKVVSLGLSQGGHLSHGHPKSFLGRFFEVTHYGTEDDGTVDLAALEEMIGRVKPKLVISGGSSCPRTVEHSAIARIAHAYGAYHMADISHTAGLIAGGAMTNNLGASDIVTFGTQKTFLGPRGGVLMAKEHLSKKLLSSVFPGVEGAMQLPQLMAKALAAEFAQTDDFKKIARQIVFLAKRFAGKLQQKGIKVVTNGTDSHIVLIDIPNSKQLVADFYNMGIRINANPIPNTDRWGIRFGTISLAQSTMSNEKIDYLLDNIADFLVDQSPSNLELLKQTAQDIIKKREHDLPNVEAGQWSDELSDEYRTDSTSKSLIKRRIDTEGKDVFLYIKPPAFQSSLLKTSGIGVIIPTVGVEKETLWKVAKYAQKACPNGHILIVNKTLDSDMIAKDGNISHASLSFLSNSLLNFDKFRTSHPITAYNYGKGWSMLMGSLALYDECDHLFFLDSDLEEIDEYDPLNKLAYGIENGDGIKHALIATPRRRNEVIHGVLNALEGSVNVKEALHRLKLIIHPLAGERYMNKETLMAIPWATNYGVETLWNVYTSFKGVKTCQVSNDDRQDGINSYVKNEVMLMYCSRLLSLILHGCNADSGFFENIDLFNKEIAKHDKVTILPNKSEQEVQTFQLNMDYFIPSIKDLSNQGMLQTKFALQD